MTKKERDALKEEESGVEKVVAVGDVYDPSTVNHRVSLEERRKMWKEPMTASYRFGFFSYFRDFPREG